MFKKILVLLVSLLAVMVIFTGCSRCSSGSSLAPGATDIVEEDKWKNPEFIMEDVVELPDEFYLDLTYLAPESWSDNDVWSVNPYKEVAKAEANPNGGYDFYFDTFNQRIIFILDSSQRYKLWEASSVEVEIDGEATPHKKCGFRYHIGWSEKGSNWNATNSFDPAPFNTILKETISFRDLDPIEKEELIVNFMIQTRGGTINEKYDPVTVTIRSIKFTVHYD